jgi:bacterioferritin
MTCAHWWEADRMGRAAPRTSTAASDCVRNADRASRPSARSWSRGWQRAPEHINISADNPARGHARNWRQRMKGDAKVVEYLNHGLRHELTAINQYWLHYRLLDNWGYKDLAKVWRKESIEEMNHADRFADRIIFLEGFPNMQVLDPLRIGQDVRQVIESDLALEHAARALYQEAAAYCDSVGDRVSRVLFEELMEDEEKHIDFLETQIDLINALGLQLYAQKHVGELEDGEK